MRKEGNGGEGEGRKKGKKEGREGRKENLGTEYNRSGLTSRAQGHMG